MVAKKNYLFAASLLCICIFVGCGSSTKGKLTVTSSAFQEGGRIPDRHTCSGEDLSPPLTITAMKDKVKTYAVICEDPDAPGGMWVHWVIFNLPPETTELPEGIKSLAEIEGGIRQGNNGWGEIGYKGPCPPPGKPHRYYFRVYALDISLNFSPGIQREDLLRAMRGHIIQEGSLMGTFGR